MKIKFYNLGTIKETELDLRPLTVLIGPNNSNKTYIAYCVYGLWKNVTTKISIDKVSFNNVSANTISIEISQLVKNFVVEHNNKIEHFKKEELKKFFQDYSGQLFSRSHFAVPITEEQIKQALDSIVQQNTLNLLFDENVKLSLEKDKNFLLISNLDIMSKSKLHDIIESSTRKIISLIFALNEQFFSNPFLLPAERNAFIITYKMLANRRFNLLKENRRELLFRDQDNVQRQFNIVREQGDLSYPEPIEDFLEFLTNAELTKNLKMNSTAKNEFQKLADKIERYILDQNKVFYEPTVLEGKEIKVKVNKDLTIDLYNASSSIKQLTPLLLYLRYRAKKNDLLIIDEPEMNLHPESQAKLLEIFGILVNLGVNVLITTHSSYFMEYLNSLVIGKLDKQASLKKQATELYLKDSRAFVPLEKVSAYEMKDNKLHSLKDEDYGIRWDTLSDVSHDIVQKYFRIDEKGQ